MNPLKKKKRMEGFGLPLRQVDQGELNGSHRTCICKNDPLTPPQISFPYLPVYLLLISAHRCNCSCRPNNHKSESELWIRRR